MTRLCLTLIALLALPATSWAHASINAVSVVVAPGESETIVAAEPLRLLLIAQTDQVDSAAQVDCNSAAVYDESDDTNVRLTYGDSPYVAQGSVAQAALVCHNEGLEAATILATEIVAPTP